MTTHDLKPSEQLSKLNFSLSQSLSRWRTSKMAEFREVWMLHVDCKKNVAGKMINSWPKTVRTMNHINCGGEFCPLMRLGSLLDPPMDAGKVGGEGECAAQCNISPRDSFKCYNRWGERSAVHNREWELQSSPPLRSLGEVWATSAAYITGSVGGNDLLFFHN